MYLYIYIILINILGFAIMGIDKQKAKRNQWRIKENTLWLVALIGGAIGSTIAMNTFRHKTKHLSFKIGFPVLSVIQIALFLYFEGLSLLN